MLPGSKNTHTASRVLTLEASVSSLLKAAHSVEVLSLFYSVFVIWESDSLKSSSVTGPFGGKWGTGVCGFSVVSVMQRMW